MENKELMDLILESNIPCKGKVIEAVIELQKSASDAEIDKTWWVELLNSVCRHLDRIIDNPWPTAEIPACRVKEVYEMACVAGERLNLIRENYNLKEKLDKKPVKEITKEEIK